MANELVTLSKTQIKALVATVPAEKRAVLAEALDAARKYILKRTKSYEDAWPFAEATMQNWRFLGAELLRLKASGQFKTGKPKNSNPLKIERLTLGDFGIDHNQSAKAQQLAAKSDDDFEQWLAEFHDPDNCTFPSLFSDGKPHVSQATGEMDWYTPPEYIEAAREVMGGIDLDPASSDIAQKTVKADRYFTKDDDGLSKHWKAETLFMNPPYKQPEIGHFVEKLVGHVSNRDVKQAILFVNNATETDWFQVGASVCTAYSFPRGRVQTLTKHGQAGAPLQGSVFLYYGQRVKSFGKVFCKYGLVLVPA